MEEELRIGAENRIREMFSEPLTGRVEEEGIFKEYLSSVKRSNIREILGNLEKEGKIERELKNGKVYWNKVLG